MGPVAARGETDVGRFWSLLFLAVPIVGVGIFAWAMADLWPLERHWLPININDHGHVIDNLFLFILILTGVIFIGTGIVLFWCLWKFDAANNPEPVQYSHGSHTLEVIWSIIPAATLLFIAIYQINAWANVEEAIYFGEHLTMLPGNADERMNVGLSIQLRETRLAIFPSIQTFEELAEALRFGSLVSSGRTRIAGAKHVEMTLPTEVPIEIGRRVRREKFIGVLR